MTVMRVIGFHPFTKFEVRKLSRSEDRADFRHDDVKRPGDLDL